jgi:hypothetical protein
LLHPCRYGATVSTRPFQGRNTGSIPVSGTKFFAALFRTSNPALNEKAFRTQAALGETMTVQGTVNKTGRLLLCVVAAAHRTRLRAARGPDTRCFVRDAAGVPDRHDSRNPGFQNPRARGDRSYGAVLSRRNDARHFLPYPSADDSPEPADRHRFGIFVVIIAALNLVLALDLIETGA